jgi:hypothetical protein
MPADKEILEAAYRAFNARDLDAALALWRIPASCTAGAARTASSSAWT